MLWFLSYCDYLQPKTAETAFLHCKKQPVETKVQIGCNQFEMVKITICIN